MNFSELVPYQHAAFSHSGDMLAIAKEKYLFVSKATSTFKLLVFFHPDIESPGIY